MGFPSVLLCVHRDLVDGRCVEHERMWVATNTTKSNSFFVPSTPSKSWTLYSYKEHSGWHNRSYSRVFRCGWQPPFGPNTLSKPTVVSRNDFESEAVETWRGMVIVHQSCREACGRECLVAVSNTRFFCWVSFKTGASRAILTIRGTKPEPEPIVWVSPPLFPTRK